MEDIRVNKDWTIKKIKKEYKKVENIYTLQEFLKDVVFGNTDPVIKAFINYQKIIEDIEKDY